MRWLLWMGDVHSRRRVGSPCTRVENHTDCFTDQLLKSRHCPQSRLALEAGIQDWNDRRFWESYPSESGTSYSRTQGTKAFSRSRRIAVRKSSSMRRNSTRHSSLNSRLSVQITSYLVDLIAQILFWKLIFINVIRISRHNQSYLFGFKSIAYLNIPSRVLRLFHCCIRILRLAGWIVLLPFV